MGQLQKIALSLFALSLVGCNGKNHPVVQKVRGMSVHEEKDTAPCCPTPEPVCAPKKTKARPCPPKPHMPPTLDAQLARLEQQIKEISQENQHCTKGGKNPSYLEFCKNKVLTMIDILYWKASEDGLTYAYKTTNNDFNFDYKAKRLHFKYEPGFRVGVGCFFEKGDQWDLIFNWTHLNSEANGITSTNNVTTSPLQIPWSSIILGEGASRATAHWNLHYNLFDLELGRNFFVSKSLAIRPFVGLRGAIIDQDYKVNYTGQFFIGNQFALAVEAPTTFKGDDDFWALGLRPGFDTIWQFNHHWAFIGKLSTSLLYGHQKTESKSFGEAPNVLPTQATSASVKNSSWPYRLNMEGALGIQWETYFKEDRCHVSMALAYEISQWYDQNQFSQSVFEFGGGVVMPLSVQPDPRNGTLGLQGITYKLDFAF